MMYKFKSKAAGDLLMTQPVGDRILALIGKPSTPQGIIEVDQIPAAMRALEAAIEAERPQAANDDDDIPAGTPSKSGFKPDHVSLRQRVWPMVEMMKRALAEKQPIVWGG
jgi:hypothetical protein